MYADVSRVLLYGSWAFATLWAVGIIILWAFLELYDNGRLMADWEKERKEPISLGDFIFVSIMGAIVIAFFGSLVIAPIWPVSVPLLTLVILVSVIKMKRELQKES